MPAASPRRHASKRREAQAACRTRGVRRTVVSTRTCHGGHTRCRARVPHRTRHVRCRRRSGEGTEVTRHAVRASRGSCRAVLTSHTVTGAGRGEEPRRRSERSRVAAATARGGVHRSRGPIQSRAAVHTHTGTSQTVGARRTHGCCGAD
jgi:hypothetical protein